MNVRSAWEQGVTGRNVVVTILDDGIEKDHPDLMDNYVCRKGGGSEGAALFPKATYFPLIY